MKLALRDCRICVVAVESDFAGEIEVTNFGMIVVVIDVAEM